jgi:putative cell wall-binding protein
MNIEGETDTEMDSETETKTKQPWEQRKKEYMREYMRKRYEANKEKMREQQRERGTRYRLKMQSADGKLKMLKNTISQLKVQIENDQNVKNMVETLLQNI